MGRRFRLAHIVFGRDIIEVATFRANHSDVAMENQANRAMKACYYAIMFTVRFERDAVRRDFTVNALYYNPQDNTLRDYFEGIQDLKAGKLCLIGDPVTRYQEDPVPCYAQFVSWQNLMCSLKNQ